jgi:hypothetical protein
MFMNFETKKFIIIGKIIYNLPELFEMLLLFVKCNTDGICRNLLRFAIYENVSVSIVESVHQYSFRVFCHAFPIEIINPNIFLIYTFVTFSRL